MNKLISLIVFLLITGTNIFADNIDVFLTHENKIEALDKARESGHTLVYFYLDEKTRLEDTVSDSIKKEFQSSLDDVQKSNSIETLLELSERDLAHKVVIAYEKKNGKKYEQLIASIMDAEYLAKLNRAAEDIKYAKDHGVEEKDLPALIFKGKVFKNVKSLDVLQF